MSSYAKPASTKCRLQTEYKMQTDRKTVLGLILDDILIY